MERREKRKRRRSASHGTKGERMDDGEIRLGKEGERAASEFGEKLVVEEAERKMDKLEGAIGA